MPPARASRRSAATTRVMPAFSSGQWAGTVPVTWNRRRFERSDLPRRRRHPRASRRPRRGRDRAAAGVGRRAWRGDRSRSRRASAPALRARSTSSAPARRVTLRYAFVADDFTGATDTLATLARAGLRTSLYLDAQRMARGHRSPTPWGSPTSVRSLAPPQIAAALAPAAAALRRLRAPIAALQGLLDLRQRAGCRQHRRGGRGAARCGADVRSCPSSAASRTCGRYCIFGNLFAAPASAGRDPPHRPAPDDARAPGHADARGRPAPASRGARPCRRAQRRHHDLCRRPRDRRGYAYCSTWPKPRIWRASAISCCGRRGGSRCSPSARAASRRR